LYDQELDELIGKENQHYLNVIDLIASTNAPPRFLRVNEDWGVAQCRNAEGLIGRKPYAGMHNFDAIEALAARRGCELFGAEHCNVQPLSGSMANLAVYKALLKPGDKILSMSLTSGGHLTHGLKHHLVSDLYEIVHYSVNPETYLLDYDQIRKVAVEERPQLIIAGYSAYPRAIDFGRFRQIGDAVGAYVLADIAHIAGLIAAGLHQNPCNHGTVVTSSVEKTLRGIRGGFILCPKELADNIDRGVFPGLQSSVGLGQIVATARLFFEASSEEYREYQRRVLRHARLMANVFKRRGIPLIAGGTDTHMVLLNVGALGLTGKDAEGRLERIGILSNRNIIAFDPKPPSQASGLRIATNSVTARGFEAEEVELLAGWISDALLAPHWSRELLLDLRSRVARLVARDHNSDTLYDLIEKQTS
jgi:glycine hydroxymethyltransferase